MAKKIKSIVKLQIPAGKAAPAPPVGTALGPHGINIMQFCKEYNAKTASMTGTIVPVDIDLSRPLVLVHSQNTAGPRAFAQSRRNRKRLRSAEPQQSRHGHAQTGTRDRGTKDEGLERCGCRRRDADDRRHRPQYGNRNQGIMNCSGSARAR